MTHSDDDGLVMPPRVASAHVALLPIWRIPEERAAVMAYTAELAARLRAVRYGSRSVQVEIDDRDTGGARGWDWIKRGIPLRVEIGPRDIAADAVFFGRRDLPAREKKAMPRGQFVAEIGAILDEIQQTLFNRALSLKNENTRLIDHEPEFYRFFTPQNAEKPEIHGGFALSHWCGSESCENRVKEDLKVTIRCIPFEDPTGPGSCICCGKPSPQRVVFAKAY
jgi:prolyl-tRNA synthetase